MHYEHFQFYIVIVLENWTKYFLSLCLDLFTENLKFGWKYKSALLLPLLFIISFLLYL